MELLRDLKEHNQRMDEHNKRLISALKISAISFGATVILVVGMYFFGILFFLTSRSLKTIHRMAATTISTLENRGICTTGQKYLRMKKKNGKAKGMIHKKPFNSQNKNQNQRKKKKIIIKVRKK